MKLFEPATVLGTATAGKKRSLTNTTEFTTNYFCAVPFGGKVCPQKGRRKSRQPTSRAKDSGDMGQSPKETIMNKSTVSARRFSFVQLDPRPGASNPEFNLGIEVTVPRLLPAGVTNLDHHGRGATMATPTAVEQALTCELPVDGAVIATVRPDADSVGAMAVLANRGANRRCDKRLVAAIAAVDKHGPLATGFEDLRPLTVAIARKAAMAKIPLQERVAWVADLLAGDSASHSEEITALNREREEEFAKALQCSTVELVAGGKVAVVESTHRYATEIGYQKAQIVVAYNPRMLVDFRDPSKGTYKKYTVCRYNEFVPFDLTMIKDELNELETARCDDGLTWGGQVNIIGSPQGRSSALTKEEVVGIVVTGVLAQS